VAYKDLIMAPYGDDQEKIDLRERVAKLERTVAFLLKQFNLEYVDVPPEPDFPEICALFQSGYNIEAIGLYRQLTGVSLHEAQITALRMCEEER
jgi:hypothetical protein